MKLSEFFIEFVLKPILMPLLAMLLLNISNPAEIFEFIPDSSVYGFGLTIYMTFFASIHQLIFRILGKYEAYVSCIFYISELDKSIKNTPSARHGEGTFKIKYDIRVSGNYKRLFRCKLFLKLGSDLTAQLQKGSTIKYNESENELICELDELLNDTTESTVYSGSISFIKYSNDKILLELAPKISKKRGIKFETNRFKIHD